jgi:hypothetical protein
MARKFVNSIFRAMEKKTQFNTVSSNLNVQVMNQTMSKVDSRAANIHFTALVLKKEQLQTK